MYLRYAPFLDSLLRKPSQSFKLILFSYYYFLICSIKHILKTKITKNTASEHFLFA